MVKKANEKKPPVESICHKYKRTNIPTEELRGFVAEDKNAPKTMLYPRDPSLGPLLVWKGKDEQNRKDKAATVSAAWALSVPAVNNHGEFGRWEFIEIADPWNAMTMIRSVIMTSPGKS